MKKTNIAALMLAVICILIAPFIFPIKLDMDIILETPIYIDTTEGIETIEETIMESLIIVSSTFRESETSTEKEATTIIETEITTLETTNETTTEIIITESTLETITETQPIIYSPYTEEEILLLKLASCEAGGQGVIGMALVMRVVLNRAILNNCNVTSIIMAPRQFSCVGNHLWNSNYIVPEAYEALNLIKQGWDNSCGALYFCASRVYNPNGWFGTLNYLFTYGDHMFFR